MEDVRMAVDKSSAGSLLEAPSFGFGILALLDGGDDDVFFADDDFDFFFLGASAVHGSWV